VDAGPPSKVRPITSVPFPEFQCNSPPTNGACHMIDVKVLRAAGLTDAQIVAVFEAAAPIVAELNELRAWKSGRREQNRKDKQNQRARQADIKPCQADSQADIKKPSKINGHVRLTTGDSSSFFFLESEKKKDSRESSRKNRDDFEQFYTAYPRHVAKMAAEKAYAKARQQATAAEILAGLEKQKSNFPADPKFIPHPATWLSHGRWLDEIKTANRGLDGIPGTI
jgi:hypothetical protein